MKKIWLAVLVSLSFLLLAGCQDQELVNDGSSFTVEVVSIENTTLLSEDIIFLEDDERTIVEIIDEVVDLDYSTSQWGIFINGIGGFYPTEYGVTYNYYYMILVDGEASKVGIDLVELSDDMVITFQETTMLDETDLMIDQLIYTYLDAYAETYITETAMSHYLVAAVMQMVKLGYIDSLTPPSYQGSVTTIQEAFKTAVFQKAFDLDLADTTLAVDGLSSADPYAALSHLSALTMLNGDEEKINYLLDMMVNMEVDDAEYAGMLISTLAPYQEQVDVAETIDLLLAVIKDNVTVSGITSWGNPSSSSTAMVVIGLIALGENPRNEAYSAEGIDLVEAMLLYEVEGYFKWLTSSESADTAFSSPQVFSALITYKIFRDVYGNPAFDLFNL